MEKKTIGRFISVLRKASGMTQRELAERLFVSDKTVSRWECDECTPDLTLIPAIAEIFGITTDELLRGERSNNASINNEAATEQCGAEFSKLLNKGDIVAMRGDLGAGKTVFTRGFARALGIKEAVSSPTYTIIQEYKTPEGRDFFHLDLYRISDEYSALGFGVDEYLDDPEAYALVEWPERIAGIMPENAVKVNIRHLGGDIREISVSGLR